MFSFDPIPQAKYRYNYKRIAKDLNQAQADNDPDTAISIIREMCKADLFFLLYFVLGKDRVNHPWIVDRINSVQDQNHRTVDLWAREHLKSTILTLGLSIWEIINDQNIRIGIFSFTRAIAKSFLREIKYHLEQNQLLVTCFPDIFYSDPDKDSPKWSEDEGIIVRRTRQYKEGTVEAWGLVDGMPTGKHFDRRVYDDLITDKVTATPEQMGKAKSAFQLSHALGSQGEKVRVVGTVYNHGDLYCDLMREGRWKIRKYPAEVDGHGVLFSDEELAQKRSDMGAYHYSCQMMLNPVSDDKQTFQRDWIKYIRTIPTQELSSIILVDPATEKTDSADYTVMVVIGVDTLKNYYLLDMVRDKLSIKEKWSALRGLVEKWSVRDVGYESSGNGATDIQYITEKMELEAFPFDLHRILTRRNKKERIKGLVPIFEEGRFYLLDVIDYTDMDGRKHDLVHDLITEELLQFPYARHDDMLDCMAMSLHDDIKDKVLRFPVTNKPTITKKKNWMMDDDYSDGSTWMAQ